jgi:HJR/Mrr/RecB family endonuclease
MLRRMKEDHIEALPEKVAHVRPVAMPPAQAEAYTRVVQTSRGGRKALEALQHLRNICLHPYAAGDGSSEEYIQDSARLAETFRILDEVRSRVQKALIFVEAREMQNFLVQAIPQRYGLRDPILIINGAVSGQLRKGRVDIFQERHGFDVMLLSPRAGGVGLTLTAANHVIHLSRWWNPAVEDQCTDRVYRIGQTRTVHVYYPIARHPTYGDHSFDVKLDSLLARKREMNRSVLAPTAATSADVDELFRSTIEEANQTPTGSGDDTLLAEIDLLEPQAFERWVMRQIEVAGYEVRVTPLNDGGADGVAFMRSGASIHTVIVQCKHKQSGRPCDHNAIEEVVRARERYASVTEGDAFLLAVTNASAFTTRAIEIARAYNVEVLTRAGLCELRAYRPEQIRRRSRA